MIILPRQARDKHREKLKKKHRFSLELCILMLYNALVVEVFGGGVADTLLAPIAAAGGSVAGVCGLYVLLAVVNGLHAGVFFVLLRQLGAVQAALMKALQSEPLSIFRPSVPSLS